MQYNEIPEDSDTEFELTDSPDRFGEETTDNYDE